MLKLNIVGAQFLVLTLATVAFAGQPAARVGDATAQAGTIIGPGAATVLIGGQPAARVGDLATTPLIVGVVPCVGGPIATGSFTVLIGGQRAARVGDQITTLCSPDSIIVGLATVLIN